MKQIISILILGFPLQCIVFCASAQIDITLKGDTLILPNGARFWLNEEVTLGTGTAPDKSFNFIYEPALISLLKRKPLSASFYNKKAIIRKFEKDANYKHSYAYNIIVLDFGDKKKYWCDVRGALDNNELLSSLPMNVSKPASRPASSPTAVF
jgi:hypothetical protein